MKTKSLYHLTGTLFRSQSNLNDLIEVDELFESENLLNARNQAFSRFFSYTDVLLQSKEKQYYSHQIATEALQDFTSSYKEQFALNNEDLGFIDTNFDKHLSIYLITDKEDVYTTLEGLRTFNSKILVHSLSNTDCTSAIMKGLKQEQAFYLDNGIVAASHELRSYV